MGALVCRNTCAGGGAFLEIRVWLSLNDIMVSWLSCKPQMTASNINIGYTLMM